MSAKIVIYSIIAAMLLFGAKELDGLLSTMSKFITSIKGILPYILAIAVFVAIYNKNSKARSVDNQMASLIAVRRNVIGNI